MVAGGATRVGDRAAGTIAQGGLGARLADVIRRSLSALLLVGAVALGVAGCGGDDSSGDASAPSATAAGDGGGIDAAAVQRGEQLAKDRGCQSCHKLDGAGIGPTWVGLYGSTVTLDDGSTAVADDAYLPRSIEDPSAPKAAGFDVAMPQIAHDPDEIDDLVAYIRSLGAPAGSATTTSAAAGATTTSSAVGGTTTTGAP